MPKSNGTKNNMESQLWSWEWADSRQNVLLIYVHDNLTWDDYHAASERIQQIVESVPHVVDIAYVFETRESPLPPGGAPHHFRVTLESFDPCNKGVCVLVKAPILLTSTLHMTLAALGVRNSIPLEFASSIDEALRIIDRRQRRSADTQ